MIHISDLRQRGGRVPKIHYTVIILLVTFAIASLEEPVGHRVTLNGCYVFILKVFSMVF